MVICKRQTKSSLLALTALLTSLHTNTFAQVPDGVEDTGFFPKGYWATSYYEGYENIAGSVHTGLPTTFHGEVNWGIGQTVMFLSANGSSGLASRWGNTETPTQRGASVFHPTTPTTDFPTPPNNTGYVGTTWADTNPHFQIDHRRTATTSGTLTFGGNTGDIVDDSIEVFVNGVRQFAYFPSGGAPDPRPGATSSASIPYKDNDEIMIRFANLGFIGGYRFTFTMDPDDIDANDDTALLVPAGATAIPNVLSNDLYADNAASTTSVTLSVNSGTPLPPSLSFNTSTGEVSVNAGASPGIYAFQYDICAIAPSTNCDTATVSITVGPANPSLSISKTADLTTNVSPGQTITYTYVVTNDGNQDVSDINLVESHNASGPAPNPAGEVLSLDNLPFGDSIDASSDGTWDILAPGDQITFTGQYVVTQNDIDTLQ